MPSDTFVQGFICHECDIAFTGPIHHKVSIPDNDNGGIFTKTICNNCFKKLTSSFYLTFPRGHAFSDGFITINASTIDVAKQVAITIFDFNFSTLVDTKPNITSFPKGEILSIGVKKWI